MTTDSPIVLRRARFIPIALLLPVLILAAYLRFTRAGTRGLTFDEQWHVELATGRGSAHGDLPRDVLVPAGDSVTSLRDAPPWYAVWTNMREAVHPPLFCVSLRIWQTIAGSSGDFAVKSLGIVCSLFAIGLLFDAVRISAGSPFTACWAAILFAVAPVQVDLAQTVRGYAMLQMFGCGMLCAAVRIEQHGMNVRRAVALSACALGLALTHYFGIAAAGAVGLYLMYRLRGRSRRDALLALVVAAMIYLVTWAPFAWRQRQLVATTADPWLAETSAEAAGQILLTLGRAAAIPVRQFFTPLSWTFNWPIIVGSLVLLIPMMLWRRRPEVRVWLVWICGTLLFVAALDAVRSTQQLLFTRYTSLAAPAIAALIAIAAGSVRARFVQHGIPLLFAAAALVLDARPRDAEPDWRPLGSLVMANAAADGAQPFIFYSGAQVAWFNDILYLGTSRYADPCFPRPLVSLTRPADQALLDSIAARNGAWLISGPLDRPAEQVLPGARVLNQWALPDDSGHPWACVTHVLLPNRSSPY